MTLWEQLTQGRHPLGSSNANIMNMIAALNAGQAFDPALAKYIGMKDEQDQKRYFGRGSDRMDETGTIMIGGKPYVQAGGTDPSVGRSDRYHSLDPSQFQYDDEFGVLTPYENMNTQEDLTDKLMPYLVAAGLGGPALMHAMGGAGLAGAEGSSLGETGAVNMGAVTRPESYWSAAADAGNIGTDAIVDGGMDLSGMGGGAFDMGGSSGFGGTMPLDTGIGDYATSLMGRAGDAMSANPWGAARGALGLASVLAGGAVGAHGASGSGGAPGDVNAIIEQMANANRVDQTTPFSSRQWSQGTDGRWTVADAFSPEEQSNYENVRGMNADVTSMAKQRLAAFLAAPQKSHSAPFQWGGMTIGG